MSSHRKLTPTVVILNTVAILLTLTAVGTYLFGLHDYSLSQAMLIAAVLVLTASAVMARSSTGLRTEGDQAEWKARRASLRATFLVLIIASLGALGLATTLFNNALIALVIGCLCAISLVIAVLLHRKQQAAPISFSWLRRIGVSVAFGAVAFDLYRLGLQVLRR